MSVKKTTIWENTMKYIKDIVYVVMFLAVVVGWITTSTNKRTEMKATIEANTKAIENTIKATEKFNEYIIQQSELNGKIIQYMAVHE